MNWHDFFLSWRIIFKWIIYVVIFVNLMFRKIFINNMLAFVFQRKWFLHWISHITFSRKFKLVFGLNNHDNNMIWTEGLLFCFLFTRKSIVFKVIISKPHNERASNESSLPRATDISILDWTNWRSACIQVRNAVERVCKSKERTYNRPHVALNMKLPQKLLLL